MKKLTSLDFLRVVYRSFLFQSTWNYERMMNMGYCFCLIPFIRKATSDRKKRQEILTRNMRFFNSNPYFSTLLVGISLNFEERNLQDKASTESNQFERLKRRLSESLAVIGDQLLWARLKPLSAFLGFTISLFWGWGGPIAFLLVFNLVQIYVRYKSVVIGYREGEEIVKKMDFKKLNKIADKLFGFGALLTGISIILIPVSRNYGNGIEVLAFGISALVMFFLLRIKVTVPVSMVVLVLVGIIVGVII